MIKLKNIDPKSCLKKHYINYVPVVHSTADGLLKYSAAQEWNCMLPVNGRLKGVWLSPEADFTQSGGINIVVTNQLQGVNVIDASAWSASNNLIQGVGVDLPAGQPLFVGISEDYDSTAGTQFTVKISATGTGADGGHIAMLMEFDISDYQDELINKQDILW